jgi:hypothetical protein
MEFISTYEVMGIPEKLSVALVLVALSFALAPWLGGLEITGLKIPKLSRGMTAALRVNMPALFVISVLGYFPAWPTTDLNGSAHEHVEPSDSLGDDEAHALDDPPADDDGRALELKTLEMQIRQKSAALQARGCLGSTAEYSFVLASAGKDLVYVDHNVWDSDSFPTSTGIAPGSDRGSLFSVESVGSIELSGTMQFDGTLFHLVQVNCNIPGCISAHDGRKLDVTTYFFPERSCAELFREAFD